MEDVSLDIGASLSIPASYSLPISKYWGGAPALRAGCLPDLGISITAAGVEEGGTLGIVKRCCSGTTGRAGKTPLDLAELRPEGLVAFLGAEVSRVGIEGGSD